MKKWIFPLCFIVFFTACHTQIMEPKNSSKTDIQRTPTSTIRIQTSTKLSSPSPSPSTSSSPVPTDEVGYYSIFYINNENVMETNNYTYNGVQDYFVYNITDLLVDFVNIYFNPSVSYTEVSISGNDDIKEGQNLVIISVISPGVTNNITVLVYKYNELDASAYSLYLTACRLYWVSSPPFHFIAGDSITTEFNDLDYIQNFDSVMDAYYTDQGKDDFFADHKDCFIRTNNGKMYGISPQRGSDLTYMGTVLSLQSAAENERIYTAKSFYWDEGINTYIIRENEFTIGKNNGKWCIETFTSPN